MKIAVALTESEDRAFRHFVSRYNGDCVPGWLAKIVKATAAGAPVKRKSKTLADAVGRPELRKQVEPAAEVRIAGETIVTYWKGREGSAVSLERCPVCGEALGTERLTMVGDGASMALAHQGCGAAFLRAADFPRAACEVTTFRKGAINVNKLPAREMTYHKTWLDERLEAVVFGGEIALAA